MDLEYDSELDDVEEFEVNQDGGIQPYLHEPERRATAETSDSDDENSDSSEFSSDEENSEQNPDVSTW